jgi:exonuclease SbcD
LSGRFGGVGCIWHEKAPLAITVAPPAKHASTNAGRIYAMRRYRFVHAADLHLDSPFRALLQDAPHLTSELRNATFRTYESIVDLCIERQVDALLVAGDIYDGADRSLRAQLSFIDGLRRLDEAQIRVFVCHGNHDPLSGWEAGINLPESVVRFGSEVSGEPIDPNDPESPMVYGISYPTRDVRENLVPRFPTPESGRYSIGLLHANVGANTGHESYAPCSLDDLVNSGYDYWALGHVHSRAELREQNPVVVYPGNPQGRHINESGPRGVYVVEVNEQARTAIEFRALDTIRWERIDVDIEHLDDEQALIEAVNSHVEDERNTAGELPLVYRLRFYGRGSTHAALTSSDFTADIRDRINSEFGDRSPFAFCERIEDESAPVVDRDALRQGPDLLGDLLRLIDQMQGGVPEEIAALRSELLPLYEHRSARRYLGQSALDGIDFNALIEKAERLLIDDFLDGRSG